jgi:hypothetical protein
MHARSLPVSVFLSCPFSTVQFMALKSTEHIDFLLSLLVKLLKVLLDFGLCVWNQEAS